MKYRQTIIIIFQTVLNPSDYGYGKWGIRNIFHINLKRRNNPYNVCVKLVHNLKLKEPREGFQVSSIP